MYTYRRYTHPLSGDVHDAASPGPDGSGDRSLLIYAVLALALLLGIAVAGGGCVSYDYWVRARKAQDALRQADGKVEYEPLAKVNDGSYDEPAGAGTDRSRGVLRRLRTRLQ
jgi:hypothetical protein